MNARRLHAQVSQHRAVFRAQVRYTLLQHRRFSLQLPRLILKLDRELLRLADPRTGVLGRMFGPGPDDWVLMQDDTTIAKLVRLPKEPEAPKGLLGHLGKLLSRTDQGIASLGPTHVLGAPAALALLMLVDELTDTSAVA